MNRYRIVEIAAWVILAVAFVIAIYGVNTLQGEIPIHYNAYGEADRYGSPASLFAFPAIILLCFILMSGACRFIKPQYWNMPFEVKEQNKTAVYNDMRLMIYLIELVSSLFTLWNMIKECRQDMSGIGMAVALYLIAMTAIIVLMCFKAGADNNA